MEFPDFRAGQTATCRNIGIGNDYHSGPGGDPHQDRSDIDAVILFGRKNDTRALRSSVHGTHDEVVFRQQDIVRLFQVGADKQSKQFLRAVSTDDPVDVQPMDLRQRLTQFILGAVRVTIQYVGYGPVSGHCFLAWTVRGFVMGQLDRFDGPVRRDFARIAGRH